MSKTPEEAGATYLLRDVPRDIWRRARSRAVLEGRTIRAVIIELLDRWAYDGGFVDAKTPSVMRRTRRKK